MRLTEYSERQETDAGEQEPEQDQTDEHKARQRVIRKQTESRKHTESIQN